ncbi:MAG: hypothetical protein IH881_04090 [Myxococcales bacterium]|nr:hypothetical protein [Myxococcales bacterium]
MPTPFECANPSIRAARQILLDAIVADQQQGQLDISGKTYAPFVDYIGHQNPGVLAFAIQEAFWQLLVEGILAPGMNSSNMNLPFFHVTEYGRAVLAAEPAHPHDPDRYLDRIVQRVPHFDPTVRSYLAESLATFRRGNLVSSAVMLGIAAERVFLLLSESVVKSLADAGERTQFTQIYERFPMKPKLDWIAAKFQQPAVRALDQFPNNAQVSILAVYDLLRVQRNELGHPSQAPPAVDREDAFSNLQVFARYYETVEKIRTVLAGSQI